MNIKVLIIIENIYDVDYAYMMFNLISIDNYTFIKNIFFNFASICIYLFDLFSDEFTLFKENN